MRGNDLNHIEPSDLHMSNLYMGPEDAALAHFMHHYVASSPFSYLPVFYDSIIGSKLHLDLAVSVSGLVLIAKDLQEPALLRHAYSRYAVVLTKTQNALNHAHLATLDSTLISILLLSLFEALVFQGRQSPKGWHTHIQGCAALLQMRGAEQFKRPLGRHLFLHASNSIRSSCITQAIEVPKALRTLQEHVPSLTGTDHAAFELVFVLDNFAEIRARWPCLNTLQRLQKCQKLDEKIADLLVLLNEVAPFEPISLPDSSIAPFGMRTYGGGADQYTSPKHAKRWNTARMLRIMLNGYLCNALAQSETVVSAGMSPLNGLTNDQSWLHHLAAYQAEQAMTGILRSAPFSLGLSKSPHLSAKPLILPLASIVTSQLAPISAKTFAKDRLRFIGSAYGHVQASEAASISSSLDGLEDW